MNEALANALVALKKNRFDVYYAENREEAREIALAANTVSSTAMILLRRRNGRKSSGWVS